MPIRAITFDFWCTLFRDANSEPRQRIRIRAFAEATGVSEDIVAEALPSVWAEFTRCHRQEQRTLTPQDAVRLTAEILGVAVAPDVARDLAKVFATAILLRSPEPIEGALDAVRAAAQHRPVGLISDTSVSPGSSLKQLLDRHDFTPLFASLTFSDEVGVSKPRSPMFEDAARRLGVEASEILHIGDLEETDVAGAKDIGATAALFLGDHASLTDHTRADYIFHSWQEFLDALPGIVRT